MGGGTIKLMRGPCACVRHVGAIVSMHRYTLLLIDLLVVAASTIGALILRDNLEVSTDRILALLPYLLLTVLAAVPVLLLVGANRTLWRLSSPIDVARVVVVGVAIVLLSM